VSDSTRAGAAGTHAVIAELEIKPEWLVEFVALARSFAAECLAREPGCRQFQVVRLYSTPPTAPHVLFFETYDDAAAFDAHCASAHLAQFKAAFRAMVTGEQPLRQGRREQEVV
jgi:quinol monooxygenase YgiN